MMKLKIALPFALLLALAVNAQSSTVTLAWNPSTDITVNGYRVYQGGASRTYTNTVFVSGLNTTSYQVQNLVQGSTYFFAVTALSTNSLESPFSNEVSYQVPFSPPVIVSNPISATNNAGGTQVFSISASGTGLVYQWFKNGVGLVNGGNISGANTPSLTISALTGLDNGSYNCHVSNAGGAVISGTATLSVVPAAPGNLRVTGP